jgi:hypothetical protein
VAIGRRPKASGKPAPAEGFPAFDRNYAVFIGILQVEDRWKINQPFYLFFVISNESGPEAAKNHKK